MAKKRGDREKLLALRQAGASYREIAVLAGVSIDRARQLVASEERRARIEADAAARTDWRTTPVGEALDLPGHVRNALRCMGLRTMGEVASFAGEAEIPYAFRESGVGPRGWQALCLWLDSRSGTNEE